LGHIVRRTPSTYEFTRREFLVVGGTLTVGAVARNRAGAVAAPQGAGGPRAIYRLSLRGQRGSRRAKTWNANLRFATAEAADSNRAHAGDNSRVVAITVSADEYDRLFISRNSLMADLRTLGGPVIVGDCNRDRRVTIEELIRGVRNALAALA
jgi:hypothetical protein